MQECKHHVVISVLGVALLMLARIKSVRAHSIRGGCETRPAQREPECELTHELCRT
jgi:hypothetical protein